MNAILVILTLSALIASIAIYFLQRSRLSPAWAIIMTPSIVALLGIAGVIYILSTWCEDVNSCDSGGVLAFGSAIVIFVFASLLMSGLVFGAFKIWSGK